MMTATKPTSPPSERSAETRQRILDAAAREFAAYGLAGARTEAIATAAGVNKALLYYYFASKDALYQAALEDISARVRDTTMAMLTKDASPGERILRAATTLRRRHYANEIVDLTKSPVQAANRLVGCQQNRDATPQTDRSLRLRQKSRQNTH